MSLATIASGVFAGVMRLALAYIFLGLSPLVAQSNLAAGMQQDISDLKIEVDKLKMENADLREAMAKQKASAAPASSTGEIANRQRNEIFNEVDRRLKQQTADVNAALAELTRQVNAGLAKSQANNKNTNQPTAAAAAPAAAAVADDNLPADMPRTGVTYKVKPGDTVTRIARQLNSKADWILKANKLTNAAALKADAEIFVPQAETPAQ
ncbi:MAG: LysM domain-containing protein [bacterium]